MRDLLAFVLLTVFLSPDAENHGRPVTPTTHADSCQVRLNPDQADAENRGLVNLSGCTDQNDGRNTGLKLASIGLFNPELATPLCNGNNEGKCNVNDIVAANVEIFSPGNTPTCARQPVPGL